VRRLFCRIADRYDLITVVLSYGLDRRWKRRLIQIAHVRRGMQLLDLATGTGDLAFLASTLGGSVVGLDITWRMLDRAMAKRTRAGRLRASASAAFAHGFGGPRRSSTERSRASLDEGRSAKSGPSFVGGDMLALPFRDASFDVVTTGYGIRNVPDLERALDEVARVLRPGGQFLSLDFDRPENRLVRGAYLGYLSIVGGTLGWLLHRDSDTYRYIPESLRGYPGSRQVERMLQDRGFARTRILPVLGGLLAIHHARRGD